MISSGERTFANFLLFHGVSGRIAKRAWNDAAGDPDKIEGANLPDARAIKQSVTVPVICTGGFQTASFIRDAITRGDCDAVSAARPLVANNDLVNMFAAGRDTAPGPARTATSAWSTWSRTRSDATTRRGSTRVTR